MQGDRAFATGYSRIYHREEDGIRLFRLGFNRWELVRVGDTWKIRRRTTRMIGSDESSRVLRTGVPGARGDLTPVEPPPA